MLIQLIIFSALVLGSITDLKKREVPDSLNFSLIALGLILNTALSIINSDYMFLINSVVGLIIGFAIGALFYYSGQWGGGDAKLVMGIGALIGVNPLAMFQTMPLFLTFILTSLIVGAVYGVIWLIALAIKNKEQFKKEYSKLKEQNNSSTLKISILVLAIFLIVAYFFNINKAIIVLLYSFLILFTILIYSKNFFKAIEKSALIKKIKISEVTEGDWVLDEFKFKEKIIRSDKTGIEKEDIDFLKKQGIKEVTVKQGIPFVPSFFIAYSIILIMGNWIILI